MIKIKPKHQLYSAQFYLYIYYYYKSVIINLFSFIYIYIFFFDGLWGGSTSFYPIIIYEVRIGGGEYYKYDFFFVFKRVKV
jgi:hypothetical protein